jgi:predicted Zn-dependent protease
MAATFAMLAASSGAQDGARIPGFLSTHPDPLSRRDEILRRIEAGEVSGTRVERDSYLSRIEGMIFGANPREGFFRESAFLHPDLAFQLDFPAGWETVNQKTAVQGVSAESDAAIVLTIAEAASARAARDAFAAEQGITPSNFRDEIRNGRPSSHVAFAANTEQGVLRGEIAYYEHRGLVFEILGYAPEARWAARTGAVRATLNSFRPVADAAVLGVQPDRIALVRTDRAMTLEQFHERYPSRVPVGTVGTINHLSAGQTIPSGTLMKRIVAGTP